IGFQNSLGRSWRTVLRLLWGFFAAGAVSVGSAAATVSGVACSDAADDGGCERAVSVGPRAGFVAAALLGGGGGDGGGGTAGGRGARWRFGAGGLGGRRLRDDGHHGWGCTARRRFCANRLRGRRSR